MTDERRESQTTPTKVFFEFEFTGLHQKTTPISIGCVSEGGDKFYAEFVDYDSTQVNQWILDNVSPHLRRGDTTCVATGDHHDRFIVDNRMYVGHYLKEWLSEYQSAEMWGDCLAYDWVLFCELFGGAIHIPTNVHYIPRDLSTLLDVKGIDPDIDRWQFAGLTTESKHNALVDAIAIRACYQKLERSSASSHAELVAAAEAALEALRHANRNGIGVQSAINAAAILQLESALAKVKGKT